ncbi:hypothetical protein ACIF8T_30770 [Streptomyces sp. NPDC085946]|uniref:hypothetical protein n=1 Tax=Streptomyces sp. NPDC085946 TaxID=3365744 RepID=UPI0037D7BFCC
MPADEVTRGTDVGPSRARTGPRHAAPKKPLFTRFHMPAGKAIALAAMPTAVLMGMGFTPTLAVADGDASAKPSSNSLTAEEYKDCVAALEEDGKDGASASPTPSPSASASESAPDGEDGEDGAQPGPSASAGGPGGDAAGSTGPAGSTGSAGSAGPPSSSDSGSDDEAGPAPAPSEPASGGGTAATPSPSPSEDGGNLLEGIGDAITGILDGGGTSTAAPSPTPSASASPSPETPESGESAGADPSDPVKDVPGETADPSGDTPGDTAGTPTGAAGDPAEEAGEAVGETAGATASASPSPSGSSTTDPDDCPVATDAEGGVDNTVPLPDDPWYLQASSLLLKGADYQGIVEVRTANGTVKKVLKYVISDGTDIGDLHQLVDDKQSGKTYHVQAAKGSTSTITGGDTIMYTESISGNLLGLIPVTFDPENPPPLNIPLIYFTDVKVTQAGQFGGTLHVPGLHQYTTG